MRNFVNKDPAVKGRAPDTTIIADPRSWYMSDNPTDNTAKY